jgi:hypothetical protein
MITPTRKLIDQWNEDEARWRRYEELRIALRLRTQYSVLSDDEIDHWAWLEAIKEENPLDCIGFVVECSP